MASSPSASFASASSAEEPPANGAAPRAPPQRVSQALAQLVTDAAQTRFHPALVAAAWQRAAADPALAAALRELDAAAGADGGRRRKAAKGAKRRMAGFMLAVTLACDTARRDAEVLALLRRLPAPKSAGGDGEGAALAAIPVTARTAAWRRIPDATKEALVAPYNSFCASPAMAQLAADGAGHAQLAAAFAAHCRDELRMRPPDVWKELRAPLLAELRARVDAQAQGDEAPQKKQKH